MEVLSSYFESQGSDRVEDGFLEKLDELVPVSPGLKNYNRGIEKTLDSATDNFTEVKTYRAENGETKIKDPSHANKVYAEHMKQRLGFDAIQNSTVGNLFFDKGKPRNYEDRQVQERIKEGVTRTSRFSIYRRHLDGKDGDAKKQMAEDTLVRNLLICGYNAYEMAQVKATNDGTVQAWPHNAPMDKILAAKKSGKLEIEINPGGNTAFFRIGGKTIMSFSQEGTWSGSGEKKSRKTRSVATFVSEATESANLIKESVGSKDDFKVFLEAQLNLIQGLLNS